MKLLRNGIGMFVVLTDSTVHRWCSASDHPSDRPHSRLTFPEGEEQHEVRWFSEASWVRWAEQFLWPLSIGGTDYLLGVNKCSVQRSET